jgi:hypothetical protein
MQPAPSSSLALLSSCLLIGSGALHGCVVGVKSPPTQAEASAGPPPRVAEARPAPGSEAKRRWVDGYWHYDGMRHVWVPGRWQDSAPAYGWSAR